MAITVKYGSYTFTPHDILVNIQPNLYESNAMIGEDLQADTFSFVVNSDDIGNRPVFTKFLERYKTNVGQSYVIGGNSLADYKYGDVLTLYRDGVLDSKFYIKQITRVAYSSFKVEAVSAIGIMSGMFHNGGLYNGESFSTLVGQICGSFQYTIDSDLANQKVFGWLPIASNRDQLAQLLFQSGGTITKDINGNMHFRYIGTGSPISVPSNRIKVGGNIAYKSQVSSVQLTEHSFYTTPLDKEVSLFDNRDGSGAANNLKVAFQNPCHDLVADGVTVVESGVNYAIVSGTGSLTGKEYTHTTRIIERPVKENAVTNIAKVENATLVTAINSASVSKRLVNYYKTATEITCEIALSNDGIKPSSQIQFTDPFYEEAEGYVASMDTMLSYGLDIARCVIATGWTPGPFGSDFEYTEEFTSAATWNKAAAEARIGRSIDTIRIVLVGGGFGGNHGAMGSGYRTNDENDKTFSGGPGGLGGDGGRVFVTDIENVASSYSFSIGSGGASESEGGATTATGGGTTYTSASGQSSAFGITNMLTGKTVGLPGESGIRGGDGGDYNEDGQSVTDRDGTVWQGGRCDYYTGYAWHSVDGQMVYEKYGGWVGGGGAAAGSRGGNGDWISFIVVGGKGANAVAPAKSSALGGGGFGGNGGGGSAKSKAAPGTASKADYYLDGGNGSAGGIGGDGVAWIYY